VDVDTDAAVISSSLDEPARFGAIFDRHATTLYRYFVRRVGASEADGLLGELFRIAFERRATYDPSRPDARPWLYGIATNIVAKHRRREARRLRATARLMAERSTPVNVADGVAAALDAAQLWPRVSEVIAELPDGERDALLLFVWEQLSYEEIAASLEIPIGTVRSRLNRVRRRLRALDAPMEVTP
jgi:RNA polymerase sigma-70 factor (ECF subfamily)